MSVPRKYMVNIDVSLILPCYNEAEHFIRSAAFIYKVLVRSRLKFEIIFVEDKSTDNTKTLVADFISQKHSLRVRSIYHSKNCGRGKSVADGLNAARGTYAGFIDIDCEVSPDYIPGCIKILTQGYDFVCGERHYKISVAGFIRSLASKLYAVLVQLILGTNLADTEAGYKFFRLKKIKPVLGKVKDTGWFWDTEIMVRAQRSGLRIHFIPVEFARRTDKTSTVHLVRDTLDYIKKLISFRLELISEKR